MSKVEDEKQNFFSIVFCLSLIVSAYGQQYDLLLKNGTVIDPKNNFNKVSDVAVKDGKIAKVAANIAESDSKKRSMLPACM